MQPDRQRSLRIIVLSAVFLSLTAGGTALAHDDLARKMQAGGDPTRADWFESLKTPTGASCCDDRDCRRTIAEWRGATRSWWAFVNAEWRQVPAKAVLPSPPSIDGYAYICMGEDSVGDTRHAMSGMKGPLPGQIYCFVPPDFGS